MIIAAIIIQSILFFSLKKNRDWTQELSHKRLSQRLKDYGATCLYSHSMERTNRHHIRTCTNCGYTKNLKKSLPPRIA